MSLKAVLEDETWRKLMAIYMAREGLHHIEITSKEIEALPPGLVLVSYLHKDSIEIRLMSKFDAEVYAEGHEADHGPGTVVRG